jgi:ankyrin repeat protein
MEYLKEKTYEEKNPCTHVDSGEVPFTSAMYGWNNTAQVYSDEYDEKSYDYSEETFDQNLKKTLKENKGQFRVCKLILKYFEDKNPRLPSGQTVFHEAAQCGYLNVCEMIMDEFKINNIQDKNPRGDWIETPLHAAAMRGYIKICKLIMNNVQDKNPIGDKNMTPLHWAARQGRFKTCEFFLQNITKEQASIQFFKCYICKWECHTAPEFSAHFAKENFDKNKRLQKDKNFAKNHEGKEQRGMTPFDYAVYKGQYRTAEIFRKYLEIPEIDPRTGERLSYLKYYEKRDAKLGQE